MTFRWAGLIISGGWKLPRHWVPVAPLHLTEENEHWNHVLQERPWFHLPRLCRAPGRGKHSASSKDLGNATVCTSRKGVHLKAQLWEDTHKPYYHPGSHTSLHKLTFFFDNGKRWEMAFPRMTGLHCDFWKLCFDCSHNMLCAYLFKTAGAWKVHALIMLRGRADWVQLLTERVKSTEKTVWLETLQMKYTSYCIFAVYVLCRCLRYQIQHLKNASFSLPRP